MPRRLPVVISQTSSGSAARRHLEEALITNLLLESGLDVNIVPNIPDLSADQTGLLCLEGIQGAMVLVSWLSDVDAHAALTDRGILARLGRTSFSKETDKRSQLETQPTTRVLYAIDLKTFDAPEPICAEIRRIRDDLATPTLSILGAAPAIPITTPAKPATPPSPAPAATSAGSEPDDDDPELDRLVDMLDQMDL